MLYLTEVKPIICLNANAAEGNRYFMGVSWRRVAIVDPAPFFSLPVVAYSLKGIDCVRGL